MTLRRVLLLTGSVMVLTVAMYILFVVGALTMGPKVDTSKMTPADSALSARLLFLVCLADTLILSWIILGSKLRGWRLVGVCAVVFYGVKTLLSAVEAWYFMPNLTPQMIPGLFKMSIPIALLFPPLAVWILGKARSAGQADAAPRIPFGQLAWKVVLLAALVYPLLFFGFGYFVAWKNPAVRNFYHGSDAGSFVLHMSRTFSGDPMLYPFEVLRGLIWVALAILLMRTAKGSAWQIGLMVAVLFALLMNDSHVLPNPLMPREVSTTHFIETASSNFIWGLAIVWLLHRPHRSLSDLFSIKAVTGPWPQDPPPAGTH